jgi:hypothetical protein
MTSKRIPFSRRKLGLSDAETVALFRKLETTPPRRRQTREYKDGVDDLVSRLGMGRTHLFYFLSVLDAELPPYRTGADWRQAWREVAGVRAQLLAAAGLRPAPVEEPAT